MNIHEYQGKELLKKFGVVVPRSQFCQSVDDAVKAAEALGGKVWVVKAQIHAGGRGKGGGVKVAKSIDEVRQYASQILGMQLVTVQSGPEGQKVRRLLIEEGADIRKEYYVSVLTDRRTQKVAVMASSEGGMDIEAVAHDTPEKILTTFIDPADGLTDTQAKEMAAGIGIPEASIDKAVATLKGLYTAYMETDASLAEINPLILDGNGDIKALDAKFIFDDNALFRRPELVEFRDFDEEDPNEVAASKFGLSYISLDGNIGCLVNGAGLAMATMDTIKLFGGEPANFLDVGGGANAETVAKGFEIILKDPNVKAIFVNIFGGIVRCDRVANGILEATKLTKVDVPVIVRLDGTNAEEAADILNNAGISNIVAATDLADGARKAVAAAKGA